MKKVAPLSNLSQEDWHKLRNLGIGGSDVGAILGYDKYKNNVQLWKHKKGIEKIAFKGNAATERGHQSEDPIARLWEAFNLERVRLIKPEYSYCHSEYEFMRANFDYFGVVDGENCIIEIKSAEPQNMKEWKDGIPYSYYCQCLHYLAVSGLETCYLIAAIRLRMSNDIVLKEYRIKRDEDEINYIIKKEMEFWKSLKSDVPPFLIKNI